jgi:hypothetical protein
MKCLHCQVEIHADFKAEQIGPGWFGKENSKSTYWQTKYMVCPACGRALLTIEVRNEMRALGTWPIYPRFATRPPAPVEVPVEIAEDFNEASAVLTISPKASAALSRRCLQGVLRHQGYTHKDLAPAIQTALDSRTLPAALAENLDAIRNIGNFAAHPMKDKQTDAIMPVEPHEADWNLEVLEGLFDHYYVQPAKAAARRAALDAKLGAAGKPAMKAPATQP